MRPRLYIGLAVAVAPMFLAGCSSTSLLLELSLGAVPAPSTLRVALFGNGRLATRSVDVEGKTFPGSLRLQPLDPVQPDFRILIDGQDPVGRLTSEAAARVPLLAGREQHVGLTLGLPLPDSDGDGVPDVIDDCPAIYDPDQRCQALDGMLDSATDAGGPACPSFAVFCDDFELGNIARWTSMYTDNGATIAVDSVLPYRGSFSLDAQAPGANTNRHASLNETVPLPSGFPAVGVRAYLYFPLYPGEYAGTLALTDGSLYFGVGSAQGNWLVVDAAGVDHVSTTPLPVGRWVCTELVATRTPPSGWHVQLLTDGVAIVDFSSSSTTAATQLGVGLNRCPPGIACRVFVDDVVIAPRRVGCE